MKGTALSPGGKPIVCMRSTSENGKVSHIRPQLLAGEGVTVARTDVHYVVTEYGIAYLFGKTMQERALELIRIAHPDFRLSLLKEAKKLGYVKKGLVLRKPRYPAEEESRVLLRSQKTVLIRPTKAGDAAGLQQFFHSMSREDCYTRFFRRMNRLSDAEAQRLCHVDQDREVAFLALNGKKGDETIIGSAFYFVNPTTNMAEVAYMVAPQWQGVGIGTALQVKLMEHARSRGLRGFTAEIQVYNANMINLAKSACDDISIQRHGDSFEVTMLFN
jgi:RimJ/RimL family protein N-acetyltransferase